MLRLAGKAAVTTQTVTTTAKMIFRSDESKTNSKFLAPLKKIELERVSKDLVNAYQGVEIYCLL